MTAKKALLAILADDVIAYRVAFARVGGGATAGLFLSQLFYWTGKGAKADGWIWKSARECEQETGLTKCEQRTARKRLKARGLIEEKLAGIPATVHYRVNVEKLIELVNQLVVNAQLAGSKQANYSETSSETTQRHVATATPAQADAKIKAHPQDGGVALLSGEGDATDAAEHWQEEVEFGMAVEMCGECGRPFKTSAEMPYVGEVCTCKQEAALVDAFGDPPEREKHEPPPHWKQASQEPWATWGSESSEFQRGLRQYRESGRSVQRLGYEWEKLTQLAPDWTNKKEVKTWSSGLWACLQATGGDASIVLSATRKAIQDGLTISDPYSVVKVSRAMCAERKRGPVAPTGMAAGIAYA